VEKGSLTVAGGKLVVLSRQGELAVLEPGETGPQVLARAHLLGGKSYVEPVLAQGRLYCRNNDGQVACVAVE
jgi:hypothetical protein